MNRPILKVFSTANSLSKNITFPLSKYICFDKRRQQNSKILNLLLHAIRNRLEINFSYQKFCNQESREKTARPYALKEVKSRWYLIAKDLSYRFIREFTLDRFSNLHITKKTFKYPSRFNVEEHYRHCYGIIGPYGHKHYEIILSFHPFERNYIRSCPMHPTQQIILDTNDEFQIKLDLCISYDLIKELVSLSDNVKVIKPKSLIKVVKEFHQRALKQY